MGKTKEPRSSIDPQILTDAEGKPTHVVLTVEAFEEMQELIEDLQEFDQFDQTRAKEELIPWEEAKRRLGLSR